MFDLPRLPDQRRGDEAADHYVERRVAAVAEVEQAAPVGVPRRPDQQETAEHQDKGGDMHRHYELRPANQRISRKGDRRGDDEANDVGDEEQGTDDVGSKP